MKRFADVCVLIIVGLWPVLASAASLTMTWDPGAGTAPLGYSVERKTGSAPTYSELARTAAPPYIDTVVPTLTPVCYQVRAYNETFISAPSNELCFNVPNPPVNFSVTSNGPSATASRVAIKSRIRRR